MKRKLSAAAIVMMGLPVVSVLGTASAASAATPFSCQGSSAGLTIETDRQGYSETCSGYHSEMAGTHAYYIFPGGWSGYVQTDQGEYFFCDFQNRWLPSNETVSYLYMSPTREPGC